MGAQDQGATTADQRWLASPRTLCFVTHGDSVLLIQRSPQARIFPGYYNGLGGHLERDEEPLGGAIREVREESGLEVRAVRLRGLVHIDAGAASGVLMFVFTAQASTRAVRECEEGSLHWVPINSAQDLPLVEDLPLYWPRLFGPNTTQSISPTPFYAHVHYDAQDRMVLRFAEEI